MLTSKTGERDGAVGGSQSTLALDRQQTEAEQDEMELEWRKYVAAKKQQKQRKKDNELSNIRLTSEQRIKFLEPVDKLLANLKGQSSRRNKDRVAVSHRTISKRWVN